MVVMTEPKTFYFDLPKDVDKNLKHEIESIIKTNESLVENIKWKTRLDNHCPKISMKTIFINAENSNTNRLHKYAFNLSQRLDLKVH